MKRIFVLASLLALSLSAPHANAKAKAEKEWTFLLYLNGNNNLDSYGALNINQMEKVGSSDQVDLVVQWASIDNGDTRRLVVQKDEDFSKVTSPIVQNIGNADMGSAQTLEDFIKWGVTNYPAKHYFVAVWDHGSGWHALQARSRGQFQVSDISWDDNTGHSITTKQLGEVMNNVAAWMGRKIDVYGSDACLMGMAEVAGEMKNSVDFFIGSQDLEPGEGWPYTEIFAPLVANPLMTPRDFSAHLTEEYAKSYSPGGSNGTSNTTMSAFDMSKYSALQNAIASLGSAVVRMPDAAKAQVLAAARSAQYFDYSDYVDAGDFLKKLSAQGIREIDTKVIQDASDAVKDFVVLSRVTGSGFADATGASIWIPKESYTMNSYLARYQALQFDADTHWSGALKEFVK